VPRIIRRWPYSQRSLALKGLNKGINQRSRGLRLHPEVILEAVAVGHVFVVSKRIDMRNDAFDLLKL